VQQGQGESQGDPGMTGRELIAAIRECNPNWEDDPLQFLFFEGDHFQMVRLHPDIPTGVIYQCSEHPERGVYYTIIRIIPSESLDLLPG
jgi:hypothetical protein